MTISQTARSAAGGAPRRGKGIFFRPIEDKTMKRTTYLSLSLALAAALAFGACRSTRPVTPPEGGSQTPVGVDITSRLKATLAGGPAVEITLVGTAAHI